MATDAAIPTPLTARIRRWKAQIPGTEPYRRRLRRELVIAAKSRRFFVTDFVESRPRLSSRRSVRHLLNRLAVTDVWADAVQAPLSSLFPHFLVAVMMFGWLLLTPLAPVRRLDWPFEIGPALSTILSIVVGAGVLSVIAPALIVVLMIPFILADSSKTSFVPPRVYSFLSAFIAIAYLAMGWRLLSRPDPYPPLVAFVLAAAFLTAVFVAALGLVWYALDQLVGAFVKRRRTSLYPLSEIVFNLLQAKLRVSISWREDARTRNALLGNLETAAQVFATNLPASLRSGDAATHAWITRQCAGTAEAIRELKRLVVAPEQHSNYKLEETLRSTLVALLDHRWDKLPRVEPKPVPRRWLPQIGRSVRTLVIALIPLGIYYGVDRMGVQVPEDAARFLAIGAWAWAIAGMMSAIDPEFATRLAATKSLTSFLSPRSKSDEG